MNRAQRIRIASVSLVTAAAVGVGGVSTAQAAERPEGPAVSASALPVDDQTVNHVLSVLNGLDETATPEQIAYAFFPDDAQARAHVLGAASSAPISDLYEPTVQQAWPLAVAALAIRYGPKIVKGAIAAAKKGSAAVRAYLKTTKLARDPSTMEAFINTIMNFFGAPTAPVHRA